MSGMWHVIIWAPLGLTLLFVASLLVPVVFVDRDPAPSHVGMPAVAPKQRTWPVPPGPIFVPAPLVHGPTFPVSATAEGFPIGRRELSFTRTVASPVGLAEPLIYETLRTEWAALVYARERALRTDTQEFAILVGLTWTAAEQEDLAALEEPCSHCVDDRDHRTCVGCACPCTVVSLLDEEGALV